MTKEEVRKTVQKELFVLQDLKYRDFHAKLIPSVDKEKVIICKEIWKERRSKAVS